MMKREKLKMIICGRDPHCKDDLFEVNAQNVLDAHVYVEYDVNQPTQVDVDNDWDRVIMMMTCQMCNGTS